MSDHVNVASHLARMAESQSHRPAVICPASRDRRGRFAYRHLTFRQLHDETDAVAHGLREIGIERGTRTALMVPPSLEFFSLTFALFKVGAVPVLIDPGMGVKNLGRCLAEAEPEAFIGIPKAHIARKVLGWSKATLRTTVTVGGSRLLLAEHSLVDLTRRREPFDMPTFEADETAAILFTSGSTGPPKGAVYTHGVFSSQVDLLKRVYGIEPGEMDLATFPLFALFGPALGMTAVIPKMDPTRPARVNPEYVSQTIADFGITNMFGSPALLNRVGDWGTRTGAKFPTLRRVISAGAPVPAGVIERFVSLLSPDAEVFTPYGATESLPVASIGSKEILKETRHATDRGEGVCVGQTVPGITAEIIPISDEPIAEWDDSLKLPPGEIGELTVRGPVVTREYFNRPEATQLAKIRDPRTGDIWHRMGDLGYRDEHGRLWFCGRKAHRVVTAEGTLFTIPCEAVFNTHESVYRSALVGVEGEPVVCVELVPGGKRRNLIDELREIAKRHEHTARIDRFLIHPSFPVDIRHNAKIFREKLAVWAARKR